MAHSEKKAGSKLLVIVCILLVLVVLVVVALYALGVPNMIGAGKLLKNTMQAREQDFSLSFARNGEQSAQAQLYWRTPADGKVTCIEAGGISLYYHKNHLYLENGKAFLLSEGGSGDSDVLSAVLPFFQSTRVEKTEGGYCVHVSGEQIGELADLFFTRIDTSSVEEAVLSVYGTDGRMEALTCSVDMGQTEISAALTVEETLDRTIPQEVLYAIDHPDGDAVPLSDGLRRMIRSFQSAAGQDTFGADVNVGVDCGVIDLSQSVSLYRAKVQGQSVYCVGKGSDFIFLTEEDLQSSGSGEAGIAILPGVIYEIFANSTLEYGENEGEYRFALSLSQEEMQTILETLAPEAAELDIQFTNGQAELLVSDSTIQSLTIACQGTVKVLFASVDASVTVEMTVLEDPQITLPDSVLERLG